MNKWYSKKLGKVTSHTDCGMEVDDSFNTMGDSLSQKPKQPILIMLKVSRKGRRQTNRRLSTTKKIVKKKVD